MTSKIVVNNIGADAGIASVHFDSNVQRGSSNLHSTGLNVNDTFVHSTGIALGAGSTIGAVTGVTTYYGDGSQLTGISFDATTLKDGSGNIIVQANSLDVVVSAGKTFKPATTNSTDLGTTNERWRNLFVNDAHFSNKGSSNSVDETWGDWTLQEGENDIFMINNRNGKKYKINLTEVK